MPISLVPHVDYAQFQGSTLVLPIVSVGNVAQLASDLIIASLSLSRVDILDPSCLIPVAGPREDGKRGVTTPIEVYGNAGGKLFVIQQRSPAVSAMKDRFTSQLGAFIKAAGFANVLLLTGVDVMARQDRHMSSPLYHFAATARSTPFEDRLTLTTPAYLKSPTPTLPPVPGSGLARRLLDVLNKEDLEGTAVGVLLQFVMEGDNRGDAKFLAEFATKVADVAVTEWKEPPSWRIGLFGTPQEQTLYG